MKATGGIKWQSPSNKMRQERDKRLTSMVAVMVGERKRVCTESTLGLRSLLIQYIYYLLTHCTARGLEV